MSEYKPCKICSKPIPLDAHHLTKLCGREQCDKDNRAELGRKSSLKYINRKKEEFMGKSKLKMKVGHKKDMWFATEPLIKGRCLIIKIFYDLQKCRDYIAVQNPHR